MGEDPGIDTSLLAETFVTLFVIIDPPGSVPIFLGLTRNLSRTRTRTAAWQAVVVSFAVIAVFAVFGQRRSTPSGSAWRRCGPLAGFYSCWWRCSC